MQKLTFCLMLAAALFMAACDIGSLAVPEKLTVKGEPGVHIPLGSPFKDMSKTPAELLSMDEMKTMIAGSLPGEGVKIYTYDNAAGTYTTNDMQAFLLRYPIAEMTYDLSSYMEHDITIPSIPNPGLSAEALAMLPGGRYPFPDDIEVPLGDLSVLVNSVTKTELGIRIKGNYSGKLEISINGGTGFAFTANTGTYDGASGYTKYVDTSATWTPSSAPAIGGGSDKGVKITVTIIGAIPGGAIAPEFVLDWSAAIVKPGANGTLEASSDGFDLSPLNADVFAGAEFGGTPESEIKAYVYVSGLTASSPTISLGYNQTGGSPLNYTNLTSGSAVSMSGVAAGWEEGINSKATNKKDYKGDLPNGSLDPIVFTSVINNAINNPQTLNYKVDIGTIPITKADNAKKIQAVLYIIIPLRLKINGVTPTINFSYTEGGITTTQTNYVGLPLELPDFGTDDLFGRSGPDDKIFEVIDGITEMAIILENFKNGLLDGYIAIAPHSADVADPTKNMLVSLKEPGNGKPLPIKLEEADFAYPFAPKFELLIPKAPSEMKGLITVRRGGEFDFNLAVQAQASLKYEIDF